MVNYVGFIYSNYKNLYSIKITIQENYITTISMSYRIATLHFADWLLLLIHRSKCCFFSLWMFFISVLFYFFFCKPYFNWWCFPVCFHITLQTHTNKPTKQINYRKNKTNKLMHETWRVFNLHKWSYHKTGILYLNCLLSKSDILLQWRGGTEFKLNIWFIFSNHVGQVVLIKFCKGKFKNRV